MYKVSWCECTVEKNAKRHTLKIVRTMIRKRSKKRDRGGPKRAVYQYTKVSGQTWLRKEALSAG